MEIGLLIVSVVLAVALSVLWIILPIVVISMNRKMDRIINTLQWIENNGRTPGR